METHTLHSEMHLHCSRCMLSLNRTRVWAIICYIYILYLKAVVPFIQCWNWNSRIHWPLITSRKNNTWPVQPGTLWSSIFQITPTNYQRQDTINQNENERHYLCSDCISICWIIALHHMETSDINTGNMNTMVHLPFPIQMWNNICIQFFLSVCMCVCVCALIQTQSKSFPIPSRRQVHLNTDILVQIILNIKTHFFLWN